MSPVDITNLHFLFFGYSAAWIIMIAFVFLLVQTRPPHRSRAIQA